jgi:hypothetical protein
MSDIMASEVTGEYVRSILEGAVFDVDVDPDDGELYVRGLDFPCWVHVDQDRELIKIRTYIKCKDNAPLDDLPGFVLNINGTKILVSFTSSVYEDGRGYLNGYHYMYFKYGFNEKNFIYTLRKFSSIFREAITENDKDDIFFE